MFLKVEDKKAEKDLLFNSLTTKESQKVFQNKNSFKNGVFLIKHTPNNNQGLKLAITFSKKLKLNKPQKNRLKRQIKAVLHSKPNYEIVANLNFNLILILIELPHDLKIYNHLEKNIQTILKSVQNV